MNKNAKNIKKILGGSEKYSHIEQDQRQAATSYSGIGGYIKALCTKIQPSFLSDVIEGKRFCNKK